LFDARHFHYKYGWEGIIQRFEVVIELAWKTLKDYLENEGYDAVKNGKHCPSASLHQIINRLFQNSESVASSVYRYSLVHHSYRDNLM
jgi:hypothetical protein